MVEKEKQIFKQLCRGGESAFEYFYKSYYSRILNYARELLKDDLAAEEIVEDLFFLLWEKRESVQIQTSPSAYLYKTAHNHCLNYIKHKKVEEKYLKSVEGQLAISELEHQNNSFPLSTLLEKEFDEKLQKSLERLPDQCRLIFEMSRLEGKKNKEIAADLNISVNTVKTQLLRALCRVRKDLKHYLLVLFVQR